VLTSRIRSVGVVLIVAGASCLYGAQEKEYPGKRVSLEGTVVSSACYLSGGETGDAMRGGEHCGSGCLRNGDPAGLVTKDKEFHILVVSSLKLAPYVGKHVRVYGADHSGTIAVDKAELDKDGKWEEINLKREQPAS
jgi:hypothetical protein